MTDYFQRLPLSKRFLLVTESIQGKYVLGTRDDLFGLLNECWVEFYQQYFGIKVQLPDIKVPGNLEELLLHGYHPLVIAEEVSEDLSWLVKKSRTLLKPFYWHTKIDKNEMDFRVYPKHIISERQGNYFGWVKFDRSVRDSLKHDFPNLPCKTAKQVWHDEITGVTLSEQILYCIYYYMITGEKSDRYGYSEAWPPRIFCSGSKLETEKSKSEGFCWVPVVATNFEGDTGVVWAESNKKYGNLYPKRFYK